MEVTAPWIILAAFHMLVPVWLAIMLRSERDMPRGFVEVPETEPANEYRSEAA